MIRFLNGIRTFAVLTPEQTDGMLNRGFGWYPVPTAAGTAFHHPGVWPGTLVGWGTRGGAHTVVTHLPDGYDATVIKHVEEHRPRRRSRLRTSSAAPSPTLKIRTAPPTLAIQKCAPARR